MRENPTNPNSTCHFPLILCLYPKSNMILWSIRTFWYKGSAENNKNEHVCGNAYISQKQQPKTKIMIFHKSSDMV